MDMAILYCMMSACLVSLILFYWWKRNNQHFVGFWALGWAMFVLKGLSDLVYLKSSESGVCLIASLFFISAMVMAFYKSIGVFLKEESKLKSGWLLILPFGAVIFYQITGDQSYIFGVFLLLGLALTYVAIKMRQSFLEPKIGRRLTFVGNLMLGVLLMANPLVLQMRNLESIYYLLTEASIIVISAGFAFVFFEDGFRSLKQEYREIQSLTEKLERDRFLIDHTSDAIFVSTMDGQIVEVNKTAIDRYGYTKDELLGMNVADIRRGISREMLLLQMKYYAENRELHETYHFHKNGKILPVEAISSVVRIGEEEFIINSARDISERKKAQTEVLKLSRAVEQSGSVVMIIDISGNIEYVNPKFSMVTGYSKEEVLGKNIRILETNYQGRDIYDDIWERIRLGNSWVGEVQNRNRYGDSYWALLNISPVKNKKGGIINYIAVQENINDLKELQKELIKKNQELKALFDELANTQVQMIQQEKLAGIGHLAAGIAHEINNPLGYVSSNIETLKKYMRTISTAVSDFLKEDHCLDEKSIGRMDFILREVPEMIGDIEDGLERIRSIVQSLRNFSRIDSLEARQEYDMNTGIKDMLNIAYNEFKYVAKIDLRLDPNLPVILANGGQLNQTLLNIVINSGQALKEKYQGQEGIIRICTSHDETSILCDIEDNGPGVPEELREKIFMPFFTTKPVGMGTGLGLGIVYDIIVTKHNGSIQVSDSDLGGAKFSLRLPINEEIFYGEEV